jgi:hypothetical protein
LPSEWHPAPSTYTISRPKVISYTFFLPGTSRSGPADDDNRARVFARDAARRQVDATTDAPTVAAAVPLAALGLVVVTVLPMTVREVCPRQLRLPAVSDVVTGAVEIDMSVKKPDVMWLRSPEQPSCAAYHHPRAAKFIVRHGDPLPQAVERDRQSHSYKSHILHRLFTSGPTSLSSSNALFASIQNRTGGPGPSGQDLGHQPMSLRTKIRSAWRLGQTW